MKILFVCTGNTCRSAMCEWYFKHLIERSGNSGWLQCASAGTERHEPMQMSDHAKTVMAEQKIHEEHQSSVLTEARVNESDLIIVMTPRHAEAVRRIAPEAAGKTHLLLEYADQPGAAVADPWMQSLSVYRSCFEQIRPALENLLLQMITEHKSTLA